MAVVYGVAQSQTPGPWRPPRTPRVSTQGAPRDPRRDSRGEWSPWLPLETRPDSPGDQPSPWVGPGKPNLPLGLRGKAGGCARVTAGPKRPHLGVCPVPTIPLQGRQGSRGCIPGSPGESRAEGLALGCRLSITSLAQRPPGTGQRITATQPSLDPEMEVGVVSTSGNKRHGPQIRGLRPQCQPGSSPNTILLCFHGDLVT